MNGQGAESKTTVQINAGTKDTWALAKHDLLTTIGGSTWKATWGSEDAPTNVDIVRIYQSVDPTVTATSQKYTARELNALPRDAVAAANKRGYEVLNKMMKKDSPAKEIITRGSASGKIPLFQGVVLYKVLCERWSADEVDPMDSSTLMAKLGRLTMEKGEDAGGFISTFESLVDSLASKDPPQTLPAVYLVQRLGGALPKPYREIKKNVMKGKYADISELTKAILTEENVIRNQSDFGLDSDDDDTTNDGAAAAAKAEATLKKKKEKRVAQKKKKKEKAESDAQAQAAHGKGKGGDGKNINNQNR